MKIDIPEFRLALVIDGENGWRGIDPHRKDAVCSATRQFLEDKLKATYPSFKGLDLHLQIPQGRHKKPDSRFQVYWQGAASASFSGPATKGNKKLQHSRLTPEAIYKHIGEAFNDGPLYLAHLTCVTDIEATEVEFRIFERPTAGGVVKVPNFYMGFECRPAPTQQPTIEERQRLLGCVLPCALKEIHKAYGNDDFAGLDDLRIVKTEINEAAGKPFVKFNLYVEFEATGTFKQNTPQPMEFYSSISNILSSSFMNRVVDNVGGDFAHTTRMAINPVAYIENLHEEPGDVDADIVPIHVEFWMALVVKDMNEAPTTRELAMYDRLIENTVDERLAAVYGRTKYQGLETFEPAEDVGFKAGLPLPRFNVLRKYKTDINMRNPVPHPNAILGKIVNCDIGSMLLKIIGLDDCSCWCNAREATMGFADVAKRAIKDKTYGGKRGRLPTPAPKKALAGSLEHQQKEGSDPAASPLEGPTTEASRPVSQNTTPTTQPSETHHQDKITRSSPSGEPTALTIQPAPAPPRQPNGSPKRQHPPKPHKSIPAGNGDSVKSPQTKATRGFGVCTALTIDKLEIEPTKQEYEALARATARYYTSHLGEIYTTSREEDKKQFENVDISIHKTGFNSIKPSKLYNVYVEWDVLVQFSDDEQAEPMDSCDLRRVLVAKVRTMEYLVKHIRSLSGTVFENATGIYVGEPSNDDGA